MNNTTQTLLATENVMEHDQLIRDFKAATFIVSVVVNLAVLTGWMAIQISA